MTNENVAQIFDENFQFQINQELRHRGDSKGYSADMGLLVLNRVIFESSDDDGNKQFERSYICRLVKFSGSGETAQFREKELMTVEEYNDKVLQDEAERHSRRNEIRMMQKEIYGAFGISEESYLYLKNESGEVLKDKKYRASGWGMSDGIAHIKVQEALTELGKKISSESVELTSKTQFEVI